MVMNRRMGMAAVAMLGALAFASHGVAQPAGGRGARDADGTIHVPAGVMPPSVNMSAEAKASLAPPTEGPGAAGGRGGRGGDAAPPSIAEQRVRMNEALQPRVAHMREMYPVDVQETMIDGISVAIITPKGGVPAKNKNRIMLNVPGGGFVTGIRANGLFISIPVAALGQMEVVTALYRQGPEARFPAATEDFMKVYKWALKDHKAANIGMFGCSAGGVLVAETIAAALQSGMPAPGVAGLYCSGATAHFDGDSNAYSDLLSGRSGGSPVNVIGAGADGYFNGIDAEQPAASPINDPKLIAKFPPTLLATGTRDFAMSAAALTTRKLTQAGVEAKLLVFDGMGHGFMTNPDLPESRELYADSVKFYDAHLGK
jgi:acetyl esterase/lipase